MARLMTPEHYAPSYRKLQKTYGSESAIRAEYRRVQAVIEKRWIRAQAAGYGSREVTKAMGAMKPISQITSNRELAQALSKAYKILSSPSYTLKGQREARFRAIETQIKNKQLEPGASQTDVDLLFESARKRGTLQQYGSREVQRAYRERQKSSRKRSEALSARSRRRILLEEIERPNIRQKIEDLKQEARELGSQRKYKRAKQKLAEAAELSTKLTDKEETARLSALAKKWRGVQSV